MTRKASIVIPAWNEGARIVETLRTLRSLQQQWELIVVDDGSVDDTARLAADWTDQLVQHPANFGKGMALDSGWTRASQDPIVFLDADLGASAAYVPDLVAPVWAGKWDMAIAVLPAATKRGGFGIVKQVAQYGIRHLSGFNCKAPLSGQRALKRELLETLPSLAQGFGIEVGLTIDAVRFGFRVGEVTVPFSHRETGRDLAGFYHRGKQFAAVGSTLLQKWRAIR